MFVQKKMQIAVYQVDFDLHNYAKKSIEINQCTLKRIHVPYSMSDS